jgi:hypothetical protein
MALSASVLSTALRAKLLANAASKAQDNAALTALCDEIAAAVVEHIKTSAVVNVTVATTGSASAQTGTGTGTIT